MFFRLTSVLFLGFSLSIVTNAQLTPQIEGQERVIRVYSSDSGSYLGVELREITKENLSRYELTQVRGVAVEKVLDKSPASRAGLQNRDVIIRFNGEEVSSVRKLSRLLGETAPDHEAKLTVLRFGTELEINATMGKRPVPKFDDFGSPEFSGVPMTSLPSIGRFPLPSGSSGVSILRGGGIEMLPNPNSRQIGIVTSVLTKQLADYFGIEDGKGVLVNSVLENSPASRAALRAGDVIVEAEGKAIQTQLDLTKIVGEKKEGEVTLTIVREKQKQSVKVTPEKMEPREIPLVKNRGY
jgi:serine protease Do